MFCPVGKDWEIKTLFIKASLPILPEMLNCKEFVNADSIAAGLSPFSPESVAMEAGRIMLMRIDELLKIGVDFAFETTLATRSYLSLIKKAHTLGYQVTLLFIWLDSPVTAIERVARRVAKGGHNIPQDVVERRYFRGISNLVKIFLPAADTWMIVNSTNVVIEPIAEGGLGVGSIISNDYIWGVILEQSKTHGDK